MPTHVISANGTTADSTTGDVEVPILQKRVVLTDAQIKALPSTFVQLLPAPGVGKSLMIHRADLSIKFSGIGSGYANINAQSFIQIARPAADHLAAIVNGDVVNLTGFLSGPTNVTARMFPVGLFDNTIGIESVSLNDTVDIENIECRLEGYNNGAGDWTGGNASNTMIINIFYSIVDL